MADTIRSRAALLTLLADNSTGAISPQDLRDTVVSLHGVYGALYVADGATAQTGITTTPAKLTGFAANGPSAGATPDHTNDQLTVGTDGVYLVWFAVSATGTAATLFQFRLRVGGVENNFGGRLEFNATPDEAQTSFVALVSLSAGDVLTVYVESDAGGGASLTVHDASLVVFRVA